MVKYCPKCGDIVKDRCGKCGDVTGASQKADSFIADGNAPVSVQYTDAYISTGLEEDMDAGLRRMADVHPEWMDKDCYHCGRKCGEGAVAGPFGPNRGKPFCQTCFSNIYDREKCAACGKGILGSGGEWIEENGKKYHGTCYQDKPCAFCNEPIMGEVLEANNKLYHPGCFICEECHNPISGGSFVFHNQAPHCKPCYEEVRKRKGGAATTTKTTSNTEANARIDRNNAAVAHRREELDELKKFAHVAIGDRCGRCQKELLTGAIVVGTQRVHPECFTCRKCNKTFDDMVFAEHEGEPYHPACLDAVQAAAGPKCGSCKQPLSGKFIDYNGSRIHASCFTCVKCKKGLAGVPFGEVGGEPHCESCMTRAAPRNSAAHGSQWQQGFTVNPTTGTKELRGVGGAKLGARQPGLGGGDKCERCGTVVYMADKVPGPINTVYHRRCLTCKTCNKSLDSNAQTRDGEVYCRVCHQRA